MTSTSITHDDTLVNKIYFIRGQKVMIDRDLAELYGVETKQLKRQVNRNIERFPADFMFELSKEEYDVLRCQTGTLKQGAHPKYLPYAFTEQGVAMLSSVLTSKQAIAVNIQIIRVFTKMREIINLNKEILFKLEQLEKSIITNSEDIEDIFSALKPVCSRLRSNKRDGNLFGRFKGTNGMEIYLGGLKEQTGWKFIWGV